VTALAVCTSADGPLFLFAGRGFLSCDPEELRSAVRELAESEQRPTGIARAEWEQALAIPPVEIHKEWVRLFYHPAGAPCPPWQSVHTEELTLMGRTHHAAMEWYRRAGMEPRLDTEPADHLGLLLTFYGRLLLEDVDEEELADFRAQHLAWLPAFCSRVEAETRLPFYRLLSRLTGTLLESHGTSR
jgi:TorA maturation chaperone TorD